MKINKSWGLISCGAEQYMMAHAERHRKELERERKTTQRRLSGATKTNKR